MNFKEKKQGKGRSFGKKNFDNKKENKKDGKKASFDSKEHKKREPKKKDVAPKHVYKRIVIPEKERCLREKAGEILGFYFADSILKYATTDGKIRMFRKGQLILNYGDGIIGTNDGRFGKYIA